MRADWGNDMKGLALLKTINIQNWIVIYPQSKEAAGRKFVQTYGEIMGGMGINSLEPVEYTIRNDDPLTVSQILKEKLKETTQMVVVVVSSKRKDRYDAIKKICCLELPIPSQVVTAQIIDDVKKCRSVVTKVAIQMNCKLGGEVWMSNIPIKNLMICGIDTYHDSVRKNASVCAFVATSNATKTRYFSRATIQETHQELSANLELTFRCKSILTLLFIFIKFFSNLFLSQAALEHYKKVNGELPEKVIIYRDGVGDGQIKQVVDDEIKQLEKAFERFGGAYKYEKIYIFS